LRMLRWPTRILEPVLTRSQWRLRSGPEYAEYVLVKARDLGSSTLCDERALAEGSIGFSKGEGKHNFWALYTVNNHTNYYDGAYASSSLRYSRHQEAVPDSEDGRRKLMELVTAAQLVIGRQMERDLSAFNTLEDFYCALKAHGPLSVYGKFSAEKRIKNAAHFKTVQAISKLPQPPYTEAALRRDG